MKVVLAAFGLALIVATSSGAGLIAAGDEQAATHSLPLTRFLDDHRALH